MNFGKSSPTSPDDGHHSLRILDLNRKENDPVYDLGPFNRIATIDHDLYICTQYIRNNPNQQFIVVLIIRNSTPPQIEHMVQADLRILRNLYMLHLFFTNGSRFHDAWRIHHAPLVQSCRSITANLSRDLKAICGGFCEYNIEFYEDRAQERDEQNDKGIANDFRRRKLMYVELTCEYKRRQLSECL